MIKNIFKTVYTDKHLYGRSRKPEASDIAQGKLGDCYFLAPLGSLAAQQPDKIQDAIKYDAQTQTFAVTLYGYGPNNQAVPIKVVVDQADLRGDRAIGVDGTQSHGGDLPLWPEVMECAYAKFSAGVGSKETIDQELRDIGNGGDPCSVFYVLTGKDGQAFSADQLRDKQKAFSELHDALQAHRPVVLNTNGMKDNARDGLVKGEWSETRRSGHAYMVEAVALDRRGNVMVTVRNPWGTNADAAQGVDTNAPTVQVKLNQIVENGHLNNIEIGPLPAPRPAMVAASNAWAGIPAMAAADPAPEDDVPAFSMG
ncbi:C2 family cysteine protease [Telmatospirillum siberiense]|uniref:Calpain catalytic domain-containing protein n=1 Tax=Telmatospirillum siberiense TaxID=382514 RepID=A0A2N3PP96_9PROT|nr:C2 family cysteine protease [Telmatospirillum siberiense]PKU22194.1 hypothetical protein CWS72_22830 [Telmatospirillum siberiense]